MQFCKKCNVKNNFTGYSKVYCNIVKYILLVEARIKF